MKRNYWGNDVRELDALLRAHWGVSPTDYEPLPSGHTNQTLRVHGESGMTILRIACPDKSREQVLRETRVLAYLTRQPCSGLPHFPRLQATTSGSAWPRTRDGRWLHLFAPIDGMPGLPADADAGIVNAMQALARLHAAMVPMPAHAASPLAWLEARHARIRKRRQAALPAPMHRHHEHMLRRIQALFAQASSWLPGPVCWLHGDYHAGNLLFVDTKVHGIVDFDDTGEGSQWLETAFALFSLTRDAVDDERFTFDDRRWELGLRAYAELLPHIDTKQMHGRSRELIAMFCAHQVLIHLEAAQRGSWTPGPGIGVLACWKHLLEMP